MNKVISTERIPIKMWVTDLEEGALEQAKNLANLPFAFSHIALMPDARQGYGMPIGGVLATKSVIIPNAVGVDVGCGMCFVRTDVDASSINTETYKHIASVIKKNIPMGFAKHNKTINDDKMPSIDQYGINFSDSIVLEEWNNACQSLGTLGGVIISVNYKKMKMVFYVL